jgi:hypothetical protein
VACGCACSGGSRRSRARNGQRTQRIYTSKGCARAGVRGTEAWSTPGVESSVRGRSGPSFGVSLAPSGCTAAGCVLASTTRHPRGTRVGTRSTEATRGSQADGPHHLAHWHHGHHHGGLVRLVGGAGLRHRRQRAREPPTVPEGVLSGTLLIACTRMRTGRRSNAGVLRVFRPLHQCLSHRRPWLRLRRVRVLSTTSTHGVLVGHGNSWGTRARHTLCNGLRACVFERPPTETSSTGIARSESTQEMCANGRK